MRIITGKYRGRHFTIPTSFKARPTTDFAKENLFNVLRAYVDFDEAKVLDLFGGTGSMSMEFLSRGCRRVVTVESDRTHFSFITACARKLNDPAWQPLCGDALRYITRSREQFDLVFADPPYALPELPELPDRIMQSSLLTPGGLFVLEHGKAHDFSARPDFIQHRAYGSVNFSFFRKPDTAAEDARPSSTPSNH